MKKLLLLILTVSLLAFSGYVIIQGVQIGGLNILGLKGIRSENDKLDQTIEQASKLAEKDYVQQLAQIDTDAKKLNQEKETYEEMTTISTGDEVIAANQLETYEYESLMIKLGNHATNKGAVAKIEVKTGEAKGIYNLKFTATGSYISITDFISAIENDSTLGFKIEEFTMSPTSTGETLQGTFTCKGISIKGISSISTTRNANKQKQEQEPEQNQEQDSEFDGMDPNKSTGNGNINNVRNTVNTTNTNSTSSTNTAR